MLAYLDVIPLSIAFFVALLLIIIMTPLAHQWGLVDHPGIRKNHSELVPLTGGVAMFLAILCASLVTDVWLKNYPLFFTASAFIILLGMLDDKFDLSPKGRLICQFGVAAIMAWSAQNYVTSLGNIWGFGEITLGIGGYVFTLICVVGVINAFNMIDGIDGLAGGMSLGILLCLVVLMLVSGNGASIMVPMLIIAALIPFLAFNLSVKGFKGNKIFMGDSGSMFIGLAIVWLLVEYTQTEVAVMRPITAVWLIGLPLMDMAAIMYRRARQGKSVLRADKQHLHNIFMRAGFSQKQSLILILILGMAFSFVGVAGELFSVPESVMFYSFVIVLVVYSLIIQNIWVLLRSIRRVRSQI